MGSDSEAVDSGMDSGIDSGKEFEFYCRCNGSQWRVFIGSELDLTFKKYHSGCYVGDELKGESVKSNSPGKRGCHQEEGGAGRGGVCPGNGVSIS